MQIRSQLTKTRSQTKSALKLKLKIEAEESVTNSLFCYFAPDPEYIPRFVFELWQRHPTFARFIRKQKKTNAVSSLIIYFIWTVLF